MSQLSYHLPFTHRIPEKYPPSKRSCCHGRHIGTRYASLNLKPTYSWSGLIIKKKTQNPIERLSAFQGVVLLRHKLFLRFECSRKFRKPTRLYAFLSYSLKTLSKSIWHFFIANDSLQSSMIHFFMQNKL